MWETDSWIWVFIIVTAIWLAFGILSASMTPWLFKRNTLGRVRWNILLVAFLLPILVLPLIIVEFFVHKSLKKSE